MRRRRSRRRNAAHQENHDRWLVSYADFITLLFAFFTSLYAISVIDTPKGVRLVRSIRDNFGSRPFEIGTDDPGVFETFRGSAIEIGNEPGGIDEPPSGQVGFDLMEKRLLALEKNTDDGAAFSTSSNEEGLVISFADSVFFDAGGSNVAEQSLSVIKDVADLLKDIDNQINVRGHTDNQQVSSGRLQSNWHLSALRAVEVLRLLEQAGVPSQRLSASGFADQRPLDTNRNEDGRRANRRVDLVVLRAKKPKSEL